MPLERITEIEIDALIELIRPLLAEHNALVQGIAILELAGRIEEAHPIDWGPDPRRGSIRPGHCSRARRSLNQRRPHRARR